MAKVPYKCPICEGRGTVPSGFYYCVAGSTISSTVTEKCRSCVDGIVYMEAEEYGPSPVMEFMNETNKIKRLASHIAFSFSEAEEQVVAALRKFYKRQYEHTSKEIEAQTMQELVEIVRECCEKGGGFNPLKLKIPTNVVRPLTRTDAPEMVELKFNRDMVVLIKIGSKTQTRRPLDPQPNIPKNCEARFGPSIKSESFILSLRKDGWWKNSGENWVCPYGKAGDHFFVDNERCEITAIRIEGLQEITDKDCIKEGVLKVVSDEGEESKPAVYVLGSNKFQQSMNKVGAFAMVWQSIYYQRGFGWEANPYVWVIDFKKVEDEGLK